MDLRPRPGSFGASGRPGRFGRLVPLSLDLWVLALSALLLWPLLSGTGLPLARDLVFTPDQPFRAAWLGLGDAPARAVPLDALVAAADVVLPGAVVARLALLGILVTAGCAAHRVLRGTHPVARAAAAGFAVWNPFVVERLGLGQWALLAAYAGAFLVVPAAVRLCDVTEVGGRADGRVDGHVEGRTPWRADRGVAVAALVVALAVSAITPTGAVVAGGTALVLCWRTGVRLAVAGVVTLVQLPWLVPALLGAAGSVGDPAGVAVFAARAERPGGALWSLLGLGGIWDAGSVPASRAGVLGHVGSLLVLGVLVVGLPLLRRLLPSVAVRLAVVGAAGLVLAAAATVPRGAGLLGQLVESVPGAGLLRDGQKWLLPVAVVVVLAFGAVVDAAVQLVRARWPALLATAGTVAVLLPVVTLPDATRVVWPTVQPVTYPVDFERVAAVVDGTDGAMASLPWQPYRVFPWGSGSAVYDPASRWFDVDVDVSDRLTVGPTTLAGESARSAAVGAALARATALGDAAEAGSGLRALGVRWLLVQTDATASPALPGGYAERFRGQHLTLLEATETVARLDDPSRLRVAAVMGTDALVAVLTLLALVVTTRARLTRRRVLLAGMLHRTQRGS